MWITFEGVAAEITGASAPFYTADWVVGAAVRRWRGPNREGRRRVDPDEEVPDHTPMALTLANFERIVGGITQAPDGVCDPAVLRAQFLGR